MNPSPRLLVLLLLASLGAATVPVLGLPLGLALAPTAVLLAIALADRFGGTTTNVEITRAVRPVLSVGTGNQVELVVRNTAGRRLSLELDDEHPHEGVCDPAGPHRLKVAGWKSARVEYSFTPGRAPRATKSSRARFRTPSSSR